MSFFKAQHNGQVAYQGVASPLVAFLAPASRQAEEFRSLRTNIEFVGSSLAKFHSILVTSAEVGDGKSTVAANLAATWAKAGKQVLLIDADLRHPNLDKTFYLDNHGGLTTSIAGLKVNGKYDALKMTFVDNLSVITSGPLPPNPVELLESKKMSQLLAWAEDNYDMVIIDSPALDEATDAQILASKVDGVAMVVKMNKTARKSIERALANLKLSGARILGVVERTE
ncbi:CpsD/CapB family tyrosine-protein kinase [Eupransor demetentiae]|uniref:Mrp/ApbC/NBP35 family (Mrp) n=1 Tax=Eupransor demetentiae TaxID=3109584 RepID=A0ABP0EP90_9LACO|nr:Fe-S cluster carrier ATPase [Lactobacillaceae bacterium LMG 33000]